MSAQRSAIPSSRKGFLARLYGEIVRDRTFDGGAALAFYLTLAIFPAMIFLVALIPFLPVANVEQAIMDFLRQALPGESAGMFTDVVSRVTSQRRGGLLSFGFAAAIWSASAGMYALMQQLNLAYDVEERRSFARGRATAVGLTLLFAVLVIIAFSLVVAGGTLQAWLGDRFGFSEGLLAFFSAFRWVVIVLALLLSLATVYRLAPNRPSEFALLTPGTLAATTLLVGASLLFKLYVARFADYDAVYGSVGAVIVLMLWLYVLGVVILLGAEIDKLTHRPKREVTR